MAPLRNPLPQRLKEARLAKGFSQKGLGIAAGIDEFSASVRMNQYETGRHTPDFSVLQSIAKALKVPVAYFYADSAGLAELLSIYGILSLAQRQELCSVAKKYLE